jgi:steroid delta-isomerase-like uncharacterized protein
MDQAAATISLIRRYYDSFNRGDIDGMAACVADDVIHDVNQGERRLGKVPFRDFCADMALHYQEELKDIVIMSSQDGTRAAAEFNVHGIYKQSVPGLPPATGQTYVLPGGTFFALRDGKIARVTTYYNLTDWILQVSPSA